MPLSLFPPFEYKAFRSVGFGEGKAKILSTPPSPSTLSEFKQASFQIFPC